MITVHSFLMANGSLVSVEDFEGPIKDEDYIEGAIELSVGHKPLLTKELVDYVDHLWGYLVKGLEETSAGRAFTTGFPDMPISIVFKPEGRRVSISVTRKKGAAEASADLAELRAEMVKAATVFFEKMIARAPGNSSIYQAYLRRLAALA